jgi:hypothetical protein
LLYFLFTAMYTFVVESNCGRTILFWMFIAIDRSSPILQNIGISCCRLFKLFQVLILGTQAR